MGRDRFTHIEWGDQKVRRGKIDVFGFCDHGQVLQTREEAEVYRELKAEGWTVHKHGWPDFMATRGDEVRLIEVKSTADRQRENQRVVARGLQRKGLTVEVRIIDNPHRPRRIFGKPVPLGRK